MEAKRKNSHKIVYTMLLEKFIEKNKRYKTKYI